MASPRYKLLLIYALYQCFNSVQPAISVHQAEHADGYKIIQRHPHLHLGVPQQLQHAPQISYSTSRESSLTSDKFLEDPYGCPIECNCNKIAHIADCSNRNLTRIPASFPKDIKRIRLERNNITEIGPYAFQGLRRLQRIDLSNNNLHRIDALAFSGDLQTLNSIILYSNKLEQLPENVFSELSQLQLLLLNANSLQTIHRDLFQALANLNLLSLYDNNIATLAAGTFNGLKSIKTIHLGKNPLNCDCNLRWLVDYFETNPVETSEARCELPTRTQGRKLSQLNRNELKCLEAQPSKSIVSTLLSQGTGSTSEQSSCPAGCICNGSTVDCSRASSPPSESRSGTGTYELPDVPEDVPVYVARVHINDNRIKKIRQTGLFRRLANSQKLDLGNNKIIDIEDNAINGQFANGQKPERVVFVLLENQHCNANDPDQQNQSSAQVSSSYIASRQYPQSSIRPTSRQQTFYEDPCFVAPKVNDPQFDSPCYNGGFCRPINLGGTGGGDSSGSTNYTCICPAGFTGSLCETNIDDCVDHQCQNGAMCVDGINSYKCICRDPTTTGEYCEQLNSVSGNAHNSYTTNSANSIAPLALPIIAATGSSSSISALASSAPSHDAQPLSQLPTSYSTREPQQIQARSADFLRAPDELGSNTLQTVTGSPGVTIMNQGQIGGCQRVTQRKYLDDGNGCQSVRVLKISECVGPCGQVGSGGAAGTSTGCCLPAKVKRRRIRMQCSDGASYVKTVDLIKKCSCTSDPPCPAHDFVSSSTLSTVLPQPNESGLRVQAGTLVPQSNYFKYSPPIDQREENHKQQPVQRQGNTFNATREDQLLQITRLDAVE